MKFEELEKFLLDENERLINEHRDVFVYYDEFVEGQSQVEHLFLEIMYEEDNFIYVQMYGYTKVEIFLQGHRISFCVNLFTNSTFSKPLGYWIYKEEITYNLSFNSRTFGTEVVVKMIFDSYDKIVEVYQNTEYMKCAIDNLNKFCEKLRKGGKGAC